MNFLDLEGLKLYDESIKQYIAKEFDTIDEINAIKAGTFYESATVYCREDKSFYKIKLDEDGQVCINEDGYYEMLKIAASDNTGTIKTVETLPEEAETGNYFLVKDDTDTEQKVYLYDTHVHTRGVSLCGVTLPEDYVEPYMAQGYSGIVLTNHFFNGNCSIDRNLPWEEQVNLFYADYERLVASAEGKDFLVMFGFEYNFGGDEYLIYGVDKQDLLDHPEIMSMTHSELFAFVNSVNGLMIQAHPYRVRDYIPEIKPHPNDVHGYEVYNAGNWTDEENLKAFNEALAYDIILSSGSDLHDANLFGSSSFRRGGIMSPYKLESIADFIGLMKARQHKPIYPYATLDYNGEVESTAITPVLHEKVEDDYITVYPKTIAKNVVFNPLKTSFYAENTQRAIEQLDTAHTKLDKKVRDLESRLDEKQDNVLKQTSTFEDYAAELGDVVQYVGSTNSQFTKGWIYEYKAVPLEYKYFWFVENGEAVGKVLVVANESGWVIEDPETCNNYLYAVQDKDFDQAKTILQSSTPLSDLGYSNIEIIDNNAFATKDDTTIDVGQGEFSLNWVSTTDTFNSWVVIKYGELAEGQSSLSKDIVTNTEIGGIAAGDTLNEGLTFTEFVEKLFVRYIKPTITFKVIFDNDSTISAPWIDHSISAIWKVVEQSSPVVSVEIINMANMASMSFENLEGSTEIEHPTKTDTTTMQIKVTTEDGKTFTQDAAIKYGLPYFYGVSPLEEITSFDDLDTLNMVEAGKATLKKEFTSDGQYMYFCCDSNWEISSITDDRGNDYFQSGDFGLVNTISLDKDSISYDYNIYRTKTVQTLSIPLTFKFR